MNNKEFLPKLRELKACRPAIKWVAEHGGTAQECWNDCERGDWMAWLIGTAELYQSPQKFALCLADIIKPCSKLLSEAKAVEKIMRKYAAGKATIEEVNAAGRAADAAGRAVGWAAGRAADAEDPKDLKRSADICRKHYPTLEI